MTTTHTAAISTTAPDTAGSFAGVESRRAADLRRPAWDLARPGPGDGQGGRTALRQALTRPGSSWPSPVPDEADERLRRTLQDVVPAVGRTARTAHEVDTLRNSGSFVADHVAGLTPLLDLLAAELTSQWVACGLLACDADRDHAAADIQQVLCAAGLLAGIAVLTGEQPRPPDQAGAGNEGRDPGPGEIDAEEADLDLAAQGRLALARIAAIAGIDPRFPGFSQITVVPPGPDAPQGPY